jgi:hypothetical protein
MINLINTYKNLKMVAKKLDIAVEDRVVKTKSNLKNESFFILMNHFLF